MALDELFAASNFPTHEEEINYLKQLGFSTNPANQTVKGLEKVWETSEQTLQNRDQFPYQIDGMVLKLNDNRLAEKLGVVGKTPRGWAAIKFAPEEVTTKILGITWQVGKNGKVTPVAELEPVDLMGSVVKKASLHNWKMVQDMDLRPQDTVIIRKAGDIIPEVMQVLVNLRTHDNPPFGYPEICPSCQTHLTFSDTNIDLICPNTDECPAQIMGRLSYYTQRSIGNIPGLSDQILKRFIELYGLRDIPDLYDLPWEAILQLERFGLKSVQNLEASIQSSKTIDAHKFLAGLSLDGVGPEIAKLIVELLQTKAKKVAEESPDTSKSDESLSGESHKEEEGGLF